MRMSKDGVTFYDVDDTDDSIEAAKAKGYRPYLQMTKNGKDVYDVEASDDSYKAATAKGYQDVSMFNFQHAKKDAGSGDAAVRGGAQGASGGFADEAYGLVGALVNPTDSNKDFADRYRESRDYARGQDDAAQEAHPYVYGGSALAGGVAAAATGTGIGAVGSNSLRGAATIGAASGLGSSKADLTEPSLENVGQAAIDTAGGAVAGAAGYGVGKGVGAGIGAGKRLFNAGKTLVQTATRGAARGATEATENVPNVLGVKEAAGAVGAFKGALEELKGLRGTAEEIKDIAGQARDLLAKRGAPGIRPLQELQVVGAGKEIPALSDDEAIIGALLDEGDNPIKQWVANKASALTGQVDADAYKSLLAMSPAERNAARAFDPREAASGLKRNVEEVQSLFKDARNSRYGQLQDSARQSFDAVHAQPVIETLDDAIVDANRLNSVPGPVRNLLADVHGMINEGNGTRLQGLTPGNWASSTPAEQFNRLQQARQLLDQQIKWANREGHGQGESILRNLRSSIDDALKTSPEKVEADALYRSSKDVEGKFFGATEFRNAGGGVDVDEGKIARLLGNTDQAQRFKGAMEDLRTFADHPDLPPEFKAKAQGLISELEQNIASADSKRAIGAFRQAQGPSSPALERMQSVTGKQSLLKDAVQAPAGFLNSADQIVKQVEQKMGKPFAAMSPEERSRAVKYWVAMKNQENPNQAAIDKFLEAP